MSQSRREWAKQQYPTGGCERGAGRRRVDLASEVPFSQQQHAIHGSLSRAFSVGSTSVTCSLFLGHSTAASKAKDHFNEGTKDQRIWSNGQELGLHTGKLYHCSPTASLCLCLVRYIEQRSKQQLSQSTMSVPPVPKPISSVLLPSSSWQVAQGSHGSYV